MLDFYKMTLTVLKIFYKKKRPSIIRYLNCRNFENQFECFKRHVHFILEKDAHFEKNAMSRLTKHLLWIKTWKNMKKGCLCIKFLNSKSDTDEKSVACNRTYALVWSDRPRKNVLVTLIHVMLLAGELFVIL